MSRKDRQPRIKQTPEERLEHDRKTTAKAQAKANKAEADRRTRRLLLRGLAIGTTAVTLGGAGCLISRQLAPTVNPGGNETSRRLKDLDSKAQLNPNTLTDVAPEIAEMAIDNFTQETGRKKVDLKTITFHSTTNALAEAAKKTSTCSIAQVDSATMGLTHKDTKGILISFEGLVSGNLRAGFGYNNLAALLYEVIEHEAGHATAIKKALRREFASYIGQNSLENYFAHGLAVRTTESEGCSMSFDAIGLFEEAVVQDQAERSIKTLPGYSQYQPRGYMALMPDYRATVVKPYFQDDPERLFIIQGESDPATFLEEIGKRARRTHNNQNLNDGKLGALILHPMVMRHTKQ